jgi:hypothetical protein
VLTIRPATVTPVPWPPRAGPSQYHATVFMAILAVMAVLGLVVLLRA